MNALLLGGNSQRNKAWIIQVRDKIASDFDECLAHNYDHWERGGGNINLAAELKKLGSETKNLKQYIVFAKSVGIFLTLMGISENILKPKACIFAGLPLKLAEEDSINLARLIKNNKTPMLFIQSTNDPVASYLDVRDYLKRVGVSRYLVKEVPGDTHNYDDLNILKKLIKRHR